MITFHSVKIRLKACGLTIRKQQGEYRVAFSGIEYIRRYGPGGSPESSAYYTEDLEDAYNTGLAMAKGN